jgi:hypothetical protein
MSVHMQGMNMHIVPFPSWFPLIGWFGIHALPAAQLLDFPVKMV